MSDFIVFLKEYKEVLVSALAVILTLILMIIKKRPKTIDDFMLALDDVLVTLPSIINSVEIPGNGLMKKKQVRSSALVLIQKKLGRKLVGNEIDYALKEIDYSIESILSTPQKKNYLC